MTASRTLVVGLGNRDRGDDQAGLRVIALLRAAAPADVDLLPFEGEPVGLLDEWTDADHVIVVDAMVSGVEPGTVIRFDAGDGPLPGALHARGTHAFALGDAVELARAVGRLPERLEVIVIEGERFDFGAGLSGRVEAAARAVASDVAGRRILADGEGVED